MGKQATQIKKSKTDNEIISQELDFMLSDSNEVSKDSNDERKININEESKGVKEKLGLYNTMIIKCTLSKLHALYRYKRDCGNSYFCSY